MAYTVYGIKNCNTVKSAIDWLSQNGVEFNFHDFKSKGINGNTLREWCRQQGWETLVNKRGTTWRKLDASLQSHVKNESAAIALMSEQTSVIKRPVIESNGTIVAVGFNAEEYHKIFKR